MRTAAWIVLALLLAGAANAVAAGEPAAEVKQLVEKVLQAYGGERVLASVSAFSQSGKIASPGRGEGTMKRIFQSPDHLRVEITFRHENGETRLLNGEKGYRNGAAVSGPAYDAMVLQAARLQLPYSLKQNLASLEDLGSADRNGKKVRVIRIPLPRKKATLTVEIDPQTGYIVRSSGASTGPMGTMEFVTEYSDFRKVQDVVFAFRETTSAMGQKTGETQLEKVELLKSVPVGTFEPEEHFAATQAPALPD